jgi:excisionase family DNA binding protein
MSVTPNKAVMSVSEFREWAGIGNTLFYKELKAGRLKAIKVGRRTLVRMDEAQKWLDSQCPF